MPLKDKLEEAVDQELDLLKSTETHCEERRVLTDNVTKLADRVIELKKIEADAENQKRIREHEEAMKIKQMKEDRIDKIVGHVWNGVRTVGSLALCAGLAVMAFTYEEKGTIASPIGKKLLSIVVPKL